MKNHIFKLLFLPILLISCGDNIENPDYLNMSLPAEKRIEDLMSRMNLYEKACQMNQFVGIQHMKKAEIDLSDEDKKKSDTKGFYKGVFSDDVKQMVIDGKIGSFLHVLTAEEANYLQGLAYKSKLKYHYLSLLMLYMVTPYTKEQLFIHLQSQLLQHGMKQIHMMLVSKQHLR